MTRHSAFAKHSGHDHYAFEIGARSATEIDLEATPNADSLPEGWSSVMSMLVSP